MTKTAKPAASPAVIVFGQSAIGKPKAGLFRGADCVAARRAAAKLNFQVVDTSAPAAAVLAAKVPAGRIQSHGDAIVTFVAKALYDAIVEAAGAPPPQPRPAAEAANSQTQSPRLPESWDDIRIGDRVLAQDVDPKDGWWQVRVVDRRGDLVMLRWPGSDRGRPFQKHRTMLGLICPSAGSGGGAPKANNGVRYPKTWAQIGPDHVVLAKEDGPAEQWWEAKVIAFDGDIATLQWRDFPSLAPIVRPRASLGLMHPAPKIR
jgi:hypothetical protein